MLHGTELAHFTQGRSFVLFLWLFSADKFYVWHKALNAVEHK